jgi:OmpA-OmpF porin, OOP family
MKFLLKLTVIFLLLFTELLAQNLVSNPSFEDTISCPTSTNQLNRAKFWTNPTLTSPDYYNACATYTTGANLPNTSFGYQPARTGLAFAGVYAFQGGYSNAREYVQVKLTDTLIFGIKYLVTFYVNLSNTSQYSVSSMGAYFS